MIKLGDDGLLVDVPYLASPNCDSRPVDSEISLLVLHAISLPPGEYGGDAIERLFTNRLDASAHPYFRTIASGRVSVHFFLRRNGELIQFVPTQRRAWHAGESSWRGRTRCNDYSIGIELEGTDYTAFSDPQYRELASLSRALCAALPLRDVAAHSDIAPQRKTDPGAGFDWARFLGDIARP